MSLPGNEQDGNGLKLEKLRVNVSGSFARLQTTTILMAVVCFLSVNYVCIFLLMFRDNVVDDLSYLPIILGIIWTKHPRNHRAIVKTLLTVAH